MSHKLAGSGPLARDFGLRNQMQRSAISNPSNIAEGYERKSNAEFLRYLFINKGSLSELITRLEVVEEGGFVPDECFALLEAQCARIRAMLTRLIKSCQ